jgi:hypothetical protein
MTGYSIEGWGDLFVAIAGAGAVLTGLIFVAVRRGLLDRANLLRAITAFTLTASLVVAGITLAAGRGGGLFWLPVAFVLAIFVAAVNAWVLLVEVLR